MKSIFIGLITIGALMASNRMEAQEGTFSLILKGNYTTGSQVFPNPNASDPIQRSQFFPIEDFLGAGVELRYRFPETSIAVGLSVDYIHATTIQQLRISTNQSIPIEDGYRVFPVEVNAYFIIPLSGPTFGMYMGGGGGVYIGERIYRMGETEAHSLGTDNGFGIHVLGGMSYQLHDWISLTAEMKFRDLQFETTNAFSSPRATYRGTTINVSQKPFAARVHTDGIIFQLGASFSF